MLALTFAFLIGSSVILGCILAIAATITEHSNAERAASFIASVTLFSVALFTAYIASCIPNLSQY